LAPLVLGFFTVFQGGVVLLKPLELLLSVRKKRSWQSADKLLLLPFRARSWAFRASFCPVPCQGGSS